MYSTVPDTFLEMYLHQNRVWVVSYAFSKSQNYHPTLPSGYFRSRVRGGMKEFTIIWDPEGGGQMKNFAKKQLKVKILGATKFFHYSHTGISINTCIIAKDVNA